MKRTLKQLTVASLVLCSGSLSAWAGESVVYRFDDWTVTITPRKSPDAPPRTPVKKQVVPAAPVNSGDRPTSENRVIIRPISFTADEASPQPAPATQPAVAPQPTPETVPAVTAPVELKTTTDALPIPPAPAAANSPAVINSAPTPCPNCRLPIITPKLPDYEPRPPVVIPQTALYRDIYFSIPFNRVEYNAYPSYRHDATMELLFNQMRPTVIQRGTTYVHPYSASSNYGYGYGYPGYNGYGYGDPPYYPYSYGLRIHTSR